MDERSLILNDGTILEGSWCGYSEYNLWCFITGLSMAEIVAIFSDPEKTKKITIKYNSYEQVYEDFTELTAIYKRELTTDICLRKKEATV